MSEPPKERAPWPQSGADYEVTIKVRNAKLLAAIRERWSSVDAFIKASAISAHTVYDFLAMRKPPFTEDGELRPSAVRLCQALDRSVETLFPPTALTVPLPTNTAVIGMREEQVMALLETQQRYLLEDGAMPDLGLKSSEASALIEQALAALPPREADALRRRFGLDPYPQPQTLREIAAAIGTATERVRQLEIAGLGRLREKWNIGLSQRAADLLDVRAPDSRRKLPPTLRERQRDWQKAHW